MANLGKLEGRITVPAGGISATFTDSAGIPITLAIPTGTYYHSSGGSTGRTLGEELDSVLAPMLDTWTFVMSASGRYTITASGAIFSIVWTDSELADILGFSGNVASTTTATGAKQARGLWFAGYQHQILNGNQNFRGHWESDKQSLENSSGMVFGVQGRKKRINEIAWPAESANKCWIVEELVTGESFEQFYLDCILGAGGWGTPCGPVRWHPDALATGASSTENRVSESDVLRVSESDVQIITDVVSGGAGVYTTYSIPGMENWRPEQLVQHWSGRWRIVIPRLVEVPS